MLIDKIILAKTDYSPDEFTGGNIQFSVSKYSAKMSVKLVLYFGFNSTRNTISKAIDISEKDIKVLINELLQKSKSYRDELIGKNEVLDLDEIKHSYECSTNANEVVRVTTIDSDSDNVDRDIIGSPRSTSPSVLKVKFLSKSDNKTHKARFVCLELENNFDIAELSPDEIEVMERFISYRDEMFTNTKDKKYALKTYRSVTGFMDEVYSFGDVEQAFKIMESKEWATFDRKWVMK